MMGVFVTLLGLWLLAGVTCSDTPSECIREEASCFLQRTPSAGSLGGNGSIIVRQNWRGRGGRRTEREECHGHIRPALISGNDGPEPYGVYQPLNSNPLGTKKMSKIFQKLQINSIRPDEAGVAFDLRCMFPVASLDQLPDPNNESNWRWNASDRFFHAMIAGGFAPFLKLGVNTWTSTRISGQAYVNWTTGNVTYVIPPKAYDICEPWPAISPVINAIDLERYNRHGALEASKWPGAFAGVELTNEWNTLICMPYGFGGCSASGNEPTAKDWANWCYGRPFTWSSRYWDGTPQMMYDFYVSTAKLIKQQYPGIRVGGPASGFSESFFPCGDISPTSLGMTWIKHFLENVKAQGAPLDFFSFHYYGQGQGQSTDMASLPTAYQSFLQVIESVGGFGDLPLAITEYNSPFVLGNQSAYVGSLAGAADNAAKMAFWVKEPRLHAAFLYQAVSGAFEALNPYSFPLGCSAKVLEPASNCSSCSMSLIQQETPPEPMPGYSGSGPHCGCGPQDILWDNNGTYGPTGEWDSSCSCPLGMLQGCTACDNYHCQFGPEPESGMGAVYANGSLTPSGVLLRILREAQGSPKVKMENRTVAKLEAKGVYPIAWQSRKRVASLLLSNPSPNVIHGLPAVSELIPSAIKVFRALRLAPSNGSQEVNGLDGFYSTVPLLGKVLLAPRFKGPASKKLGPLQPFQTVKLKVFFTGCAHEAPRRYYN